MRLPEAPGARRSGYQELTGARFGRTVVILAGATYNMRPVGGLRFDLDSRRWRKLARSPLRWRNGYAATQTDTEMVVWGGASNSGLLSDGARYDTRLDRWREMAPSPLSPRFGVSAVWTGDEVLFYGGATGKGESVPGTSETASYEPAADRWKPLPESPIPGRFAPVAVWTGEEMVVWGGRAAVELGGGRERFLSDGATYDPSSRSWRPIAESPFPATEESVGVWTEARLFVWNGQRAATYDPDSDRWEAAAPSPLVPGFYGGVSTGEELVLWGASTGDITARSDDRSRGAAYDPRTDTWRLLPKGPLGPRGRHAMVWTGETVLVWGGCCGGKGEFDFAVGAEYRPGE